MWTEASAVTARLSQLICSATVHCSVICRLDQLKQNFIKMADPLEYKLWDGQLEKILLFIMHVIYTYIFALDVIKCA